MVDGSAGLHFADAQHIRKGNSGYCMCEGVVCLARSCVEVASVPDGATLGQNGGRKGEEMETPLRSG
jgi:hypothetical protein